MYTGLRVDATIKPEFDGAIRQLHEGDDHDWVKIAIDFPEFREFADYERSSFIPFGGSAYMPETWFDIVPEGEDNQGEDNWNLTHYDPETRRWRFACSVKNYEDVIEKFLETVLPVIAGEVAVCEVLYEEWDYPKKFGLVDGKMVEPPGERYHPDSGGYGGRP